MNMTVTKVVENTDKEASELTEVQKIDAEMRSLASKLDDTSRIVRELRLSIAKLQLKRNAIHDIKPSIIDQLAAQKKISANSPKKPSAFVPIRKRHQHKAV